MSGNVQCPACGRFVPNREDVRVALDDAKVFFVGSDKAPVVLSSVILLDHWVSGFRDKQEYLYPRDEVALVLPLERGGSGV